MQLVLDRLTSIETNIQTTRGEWYTMRILPYRSLDNYINGAVITFTDITALKLLETRLQDHARFTDSMQATVREPQLALDGGLIVLSANQAFAELMRQPAAALVGQPLPVVGGGTWKQPALLKQLRALLDPTIPTTEFDGLTLRITLPGQGPQQVLLYGHRLLHQGLPTGQIMMGVRALQEAS